MGEKFKVFENANSLIKNDWHNYVCAKVQV